MLRVWLTLFPYAERKARLMQQYSIEKQIVYGLAFLLTILILASCVVPTLPTTVTPGATVPETPNVTPEATGQTPAATADITGLENTQWQLVAFGPADAQTPVIADSTVTIEFKANGEVGGSGGCNSYGGTYTVEEGRLVLSEIVSTLMACADQTVTEQEVAYLAALQAAGRFAIADGMLTIWYDSESSTLTFVQASSMNPSLTPGATITATETITPATASVAVP